MSSCEFQRPGYTQRFGIEIWTKKKKKHLCLVKYKQLRTVHGSNNSNPFSAFSSFLEYVNNFFFKKHKSKTNSISIFYKLITRNTSLDHYNLLKINEETDALSEI